MGHPLVNLEACRICVTCYPLQDMDFIYLFQKNVEFQHELDFIQGEIKQWQLKIKENDGLPQRICANCFAKFCSIEAFRKECEQAQEKLLESLAISEQQETNKPLDNLEQLKQSAIKAEHLLLTSNNNPLPLLGGIYTSAVNTSLEVDHQVLLPNTSHVEGLNDFPVFDQQFDQYDNPSLMDSSATLLDNNLIDPSTDFLSTENLFTFETAEPPSSGTLPLVETEIPSIMNGIMDVAGANASPDSEDGKTMIKHVPENKLERSIISIKDVATATSTSIANSQCKKGKTTITNTWAINIRNRPNSTTIIKTEVQKMSQHKNHINLSKAKHSIPPLPIREVNGSDNECDDSHVSVRLKGLPYACHYCYCPSSGPIDHLCFTDDDCLSQHFFDKHDPNRPYNCPHCQYSYKTKKLRDNHVRLIHEINKTQNCNYCQKILKGSPEVHQYNCQHVGDWECNQCQKKFNNTPLYRYRLHQREHENKNFKCSMCDKTFMRKANLEAHERMHKSDKKTQWHCGQCNTNFNTDYDLRHHKNQQHNDDSSVKGKAFANIGFLQHHTRMQQNHQKDSSGSDSVAAQTSQAPHICLKCNLTFATLEGLQRHLKEGSVNNGQCLPPSSYNFKERRRLQRQGVFPCFLCPRRFHLRSQLDKHLNTHDARLRPFQCVQCYVRCRNVVELKQHVNVTHLNIKDFACKLCGKCFGCKRDLRDHMLFHQEINVFCTEEGCDYACKNDKALRDHIRHKHRLLSCEYCHEKFTRQKLTVHLRNVHRAEIYEELSGECDNYYKSKVLNNNNDMTQISFNLLNNTQASGLTTPTPSSSLSSCSPCAAGVNGQAVTATSASSTTPASPLLSKSLSSSGISISMYNNKSNAQQSTSATLDTISSNYKDLHQIEDDDQKQKIHEQVQQQQFQDQQQELPSIFVTDHNSNNLALNGFVSACDDLNLESHDNETNMFIVSPTHTAADVQPLDQYFMASLMDTEQEIIVSS